ncbi:hypothetical protein OROGR_023916 [Orobanche gracilis]
MAIKFPARGERMVHDISDLGDESLENCVNGFDEKNLIGKFQFGEVYRGTLSKQEVIVKIWKEEKHPGENAGRLEEEIEIQEYFSWFEFHPNLAKLWAVCRQGKYLAAVYNLNPKAINTLHNLIEKDSFTWEQRIKVAFGLASFIRYMHTPHPNCPSDLPYLIRNIDAAHILVDEEHEALIFDLSMISGGILTDKRDLLNQYIEGCDGYADPVWAKPGKWSDRCDVFSYGVVLLCLIRKIANVHDVYARSNNEHKQQYLVDYCKPKSSLVHKSLQSEPDFHSSDAIAIIKLAIKCVEGNPQKRPTMEQVVRAMQKLHIVKKNANTWECCRMLDGVNKVYQSPNLPQKDRGAKLYQKPLGCDQGLEQSRTSFKSPIVEEYDIKGYSSVQLNDVTGGFSEKYLIGECQFGKVFHGVIEGKKRTLKIWETVEQKGLYQFYNEERLRDEISLLHHPRLFSHPNLVKMNGYCFEKELVCAVYDLDPLDSLHNLIPKDEFDWVRRVKVIYEIANLLEFLHRPISPHPPYRIGNIDAAHIILDKEYSPKLLDFGMTVGGIILSSRQSRTEALRYDFGNVDTSKGGVFEARDIFGFGCLLLCLIHKKVPVPTLDMDDRFYPDFAAQVEYEEYYEKSGKTYGFSFVHKCLEKQPGFVKKDGVELTGLGLKCVDLDADKRPSMEMVVKKLRNLCVIQSHAKVKGIQKMF